MFLHRDFTDAEATAKGRVTWVAKDDVKAQARFVANLFGIAA